MKLFILLATYCFTSSASAAIGVAGPDYKPAFEPCLPLAKLAQIACIDRVYDEKFNKILNEHSADNARLDATLAKEKKIEKKIKGWISQQDKKDLNPLALNHMLEETRKKIKILEETRKKIKILKDEEIHLLKSTKQQLEISSKMTSQILPKITIDKAKTPKTKLDAVNHRYEVAKDKYEAAKSKYNAASSTDKEAAFKVLMKRGEELRKLKDIYKKMQRRPPLGVVPMGIVPELPYDDDDDDELHHSDSDTGSTQ